MAASEREDFDCLYVSEYNNYGDTNPGMALEPGDHVDSVERVDFGGVSRPLHKDTRMVMLYSTDRCLYQFVQENAEPDIDQAFPMEAHYEIPRIVHMGSNLRIAVWRFVLAALVACSLLYPKWAQAQVIPGVGPSQLWTVTQSGADTASSNVSFTPPSSNRLAYVCGIEVTGGGATAATPVTATLGPLVGNVTQNFTYGYALGAGVANLPLTVYFNPCVPQNAPGGTVTLTVPGAAGNTNNTLTMWGYQQ